MTRGTPPGKVINPWLECSMLKRLPPGWKWVKKNHFYLYQCMKRTCDRLPIFSVSIWKNTAVFAWRGFWVNGRWMRQYSKTLLLMFDLLHIWTITQYLTFFTAMSTEPSQAPSILMKPTKLAPLSTIAMFILNKKLIRTTTVQCNEMVHLWSVKGGYEHKHKC